MKNAVVYGGLLVALLSCAGPPPRARRSGHFDGSRFHNEPLVPEVSLGDVFEWQVHAQAIPWPRWVETRVGRVEAPGRGELRLTFVNHSTFLIQMGDVSVLTDPVWSDRVGPTSWLGPKRHHAPGLRFEDLPAIDAVVLSHDHYDHMDVPTLRRLGAAHPVTVLAGLGNEEVLSGIAPHVVTLDWWQCQQVKSIEVCAVPAQHNSRRGLGDGNRTLWAGFWISGVEGTVFFAGDTGFGPHFEAIRGRKGSPCVALLPIGAYLPRWFMAPNHMGPDEALDAHDILRPRLSLAMHFGTFRQSDEGIDDPARELKNAVAVGEHQPFEVPEVGQPIHVRCAP